MSDTTIKRSGPATRAPAFAAALLCSAVSAELAAQGVLEEVVVTARKRAESIQDVPIAVTAFSAEQLARFDTQSVMDMSNRVPNLVAPRNTVSFAAPQFYMRGAGRAENNWNFENAVAVFLDDVYLQSTAGAYIDMLDIESVEVLRGPQGTLYGRNATTGAIKFTTRAPELERTRFAVEATAGRFNRQDLKLTYSAPIIENTLGFKLDLFQTSNDGFQTLVDLANNPLDDDYGEQEHRGIRAGFLWRPSDTAEVQLILDGSEQDNGVNLITPVLPGDPSLFLSKTGAANWSPLYGPNRGAAEPLLTHGGADFESFNMTLKASIETGIGTLKSITSWREYDDYYTSQLASFGFPLQVAPGASIWTFVDSDNEFEQFTQEFQLTGNFGERLDYVAGLYYFQNDWAQRQYVGALLPIEFSPVCCFPGQDTNFGGAWNDTAQDSESVAVYIDATYQLTDTVNIFFGGRQTWDDKSVDYLSFAEDGQTVIPGFPVSPSESWSEFTPRIGADWEVRDGVLLFASFARGFKAGALEGARATDASFAQSWLDPEIVDTIEIGVKGDWFGGRVRTNVAVFFSEYQDKVDLVSPQAAATADVDINGVELELSWAATDDLMLWANFGFLDAEYTSADADHPIFNGYGIPGNAPGLSAEPVATPEYTFAIGANYRLELGDRGTLDFNVDVSGVDDHYSGLGVENFDSEIVESYELLGASLAWRSASERWGVSLGGANLTDEEYWTTTMFGFTPGRTYGPGSTWYLKLNYDFE